MVFGVVLLQVRLMTGEEEARADGR